MDLLVLNNILKLIGHWHVFFVHFSIALIPLSFLVFYINRNTYFENLNSTLKLIFNGTLASCILSILFGFVLEHFEKFEHELLFEHKLFGILSFIFAGLSIFLIQSSNKSISRKSYIIVGLTFSTVFVFITGFYGGTIRFGDGYFINKLITGDSENWEKEYHEKLGPIFNRNCISCHSYTNPMAGLNLQNPKSLFNGGFRGPLVLAGNAYESLIYKLITKSPQDKFHMPKHRGVLSQREINKVELWINQLNPNEIKKYTLDIDYNERVNEHWSFKNFTKPPIPKLKRIKKEYAFNEIDLFINKEIENRLLSPAEIASWPIIFRRMKFDLLGLPLTEKEVLEIENSKNPQILYNSYLDEYLEREDYGERWAIYWMDLVRYADTQGHEDDYEIPGSFHYRDWIIKSLNSNTPINQFYRHQFAGDKFPLKNQKDLIGTNFYRVAPFSTSTPNKKRKFIHMDNQMSTLFQVSLGMNLRCARCHDHNTEPISQNLYYSLLTGFFDLEETDLYGKTKQIQQLNEQLEFGDNFKQLSSVPEFSIRQNKIIWETTVFKRGDVHSAGKKVSFKLPDFYEGTETNPTYWKSKSTANNSPRTILTSWLLDTEVGAGKHTARVFVDHIWRELFGKGLVKNPGNFGLTSNEPLQIELLNWLTHNFIENSWSLKQLHKKILNSRTYKLGTKPNSYKSPLNVFDELYVYRTPKRIHTEFLKDAISQFSGGLNPKKYGYGVKLPLTNYEKILAEKTANHTSSEWESKRKSVYHFKRRNFSYDFEESLKTAQKFESEFARHEISDFKHALFFISSPTVKQLAQTMGKNISKQKMDDTQKINRIFRTVISRSASKKEINEFQKKITELRNKNIDEYNIFTKLTKYVISSHEFAFLM